MDSPGVAPGLPACGAGVFLLDDEPESGSRGTRTHNGRAAACFQNRFLIRPDDFHAFNQAPGVGIEPTASWFRARRHYQQQLPRIAWNLSTPCRRHGSLCQLGEKGSNLRFLVQSQAACR